MTAGSRVIRENGNVAVHALYWRNPIASFQFNAQHVKVKTLGFLRLIHVRAKLQVAHPTSRKENGNQLRFRIKQPPHHYGQNLHSQRLKTLFCALKANFTRFSSELFKAL
jgi:hypothetical protein